MNDLIAFVSDIYVSCPCGESHLMQQGLTKPVYWCSDGLKSLQVGDMISFTQNGETIHDSISEINETG